MAHYVSRGSIPNKRHIVHKVDDEHTYEELISRAGFSDVYSNAYHLHMPTAVKTIGETTELALTEVTNQPHRHRHMRTDRLPAGGDFLSGRHTLAFNSDCTISTCEPTKSDNAFYRNGRADELVFVHHGQGTLETQFGHIKFRPGDYLVIPRGVIHRYVLDDGRVKLLTVESSGPIETPKHFRNQYGQLLEHAPYCERDMRLPEFQPPINQKGDFEIRIKLGRQIQSMTLGHHPFDLVGWDGYYYPWAFNINDFMPAVGKVHLPPPVHLTFTAPGFVICSFVPRLFDFHEAAIPIPYAHSNVDSDEVLYYVDGNFMSRKGIDSESITLHPMGYPHGPQPGLLDGSLGKTETHEVAVMIDTFAPLSLGPDALEIDDPDYPQSWLEDNV